MSRRSPRKPAIADAPAPPAPVSSHARRTARPVDAVAQIMGATASLVGDEFLRTVVTMCATTLDVEYAFVTELTDEPQVSRIVAFWDDGSLHIGASFPITDTPGAEILRSRHVVSYSHDLAARFPRTHWIVENNIQAFLGVPLIAT